MHDWIRGFYLQAMFAATGATIVSGAVAERVKLSSFMIFAVVFVALAYPIAGSWHWGGGWLANMDFKDFAGSTVVHALVDLALSHAFLFLGLEKASILKMELSQFRLILFHLRPLAYFS